MAKLIDAIIALGEVNVPRDIRGGLHLLGHALSRVVQGRQTLARIESRVMVHTGMWSAEVTALEAEYKIKLDDLMVNDAHVRGAPNAEARAARARQMCVEERRQVSLAKKERAVWEALSKVCSQVRENLKTAKESVSRLCDIAEMEVNTAGLGLGDPRSI